MIQFYCAIQIFYTLITSINTLFKYLRILYDLILLRLTSKQLVSGLIMLLIYIIYKHLDILHIVKIILN